MVTTQSGEKLKLEINIPVQLSLTGVTVVPDNGYGPSVAIDGAYLDGRPVSGFVSGKVWAVLKAFGEAGAIVSQKYDEAPTTRYTIPVTSAGPYELLRRKEGSDKFALFTCRPVSSMALTPPAVKPAAPVATAQAPARVITYAKPDTDDTKAAFKYLANEWYIAWQVAGTVVDKATPDLAQIDRQDLATTLFIQYSKMLGRRGA